MPKLSNEVANTIRCNLIHLKLLIIDEISMVGCNTLTKIDTRLRQITNKNENFEGISVIVVGDLNQLPPVQDGMVYSTPKISLLSKLAGNVLWDEFKLFELTQIMRQKDDLAYITALNNLVHCSMTDEDNSLIQSRIVQDDQVPESAIRLFYENKNVDVYNIKKIQATKGETFFPKVLITLLVA